jgi:hypothetical protein
MNRRQFSSLFLTAGALLAARRADAGANTVSSSDSLAARKKKMIAFHIDMRMPHYRSDYLKKWIGHLARHGYNTVVWEVTDGVTWETCPGVSPPSALPKAEFRQVLAESRKREIEPVPLLATLGHAEYVLKHTRYAPLRDDPQSDYQYCPLRPDVLSFLHKWMLEYLDLFGDVKYFHIACDEARLPIVGSGAQGLLQGKTPGQVYAEHVNAVSEPLRKRGITPIIWADMALADHSVLELLSHDVMLFDWRYDLTRGSGKVVIWGKNGGLKTKAELTKEDISQYGKYLFPKGDAPGVQPETFYTADFLADKGYRVVTCPASKCAGDTVFTPRTELHLNNTYDQIQKGMAPNLSGSMLVSWSHHMHPWELQLPSIDIPGFLYANPAASLDDYRTYFVKERFGIEDASFWKASELLSGSCLFTDTSSLGYGMDIEPVAPNWIRDILGRLKEQSKLTGEIERCRLRSREYQDGLELFETLERRATKGKENMGLWKLAARNLINRAQAAELLLVQQEGELSGDPLRAEARQVLREMRRLRQRTDAMYAQMIRQPRRDLVLYYIYDAVEKAVADLAPA